MALLDDVKDALRVSDVNKDTEINDLITAAQSDLMLAGVVSYKSQDDTDPLIKRAIVLYVKANYGWDNQEADRFQKSYDLLKASLTLSGDYMEVSE
jgi:uncharacterized phage protein (predicted DNA packaging)